MGQNTGRATKLMSNKQMHWTSGVCKGSSIFEGKILSEIVIYVAWQQPAAISTVKSQHLSLFGHKDCVDGKADRNRHGSEFVPYFLLSSDKFSILFLSKIAKDHLYKILNFNNQWLHFHHSMLIYNYLRQYWAGIKTMVKLKMIDNDQL